MTWALIFAAYTGAVVVGSRWLVPARYVDLVVFGAMAGMFAMVSGSAVLLLGIVWGPVYLLGRRTDWPVAARLAVQAGATTSVCVATYFVMTAAAEYDYPGRSTEAFAVTACAVVGSWITCGAVWGVGRSMRLARRTSAGPP